MGEQCVVCGNGIVELRPIRDRDQSYRVFDHFEIPVDFQISSCSTCHEEFWGPGDYERLEEALKPAYRAEFSRLATDSIDALVQAGLQVQELEQVLDLSPGYLSKVRSGAKGSSTLAATLALLAVDPIGRVSELRHLWAERAVPTRIDFALKAHFLAELGKRPSMTNYPVVSVVGMSIPAAANDDLPMVA